MVEQAEPLSVVYKWPIINSLIEVLVKDSAADPHSKKMNESITYVLIDSLLEIAKVSCYMCDGYGHHPAKCPTAPLIRDLADKKSNAKTKNAITAAIENSKIKGFRAAMAVQVPGSNN